jgi:hypothetical protein
VNANVVIGFPAIALVEGKHAGSRINISWQSDDTDTDISVNLVQMI